MSDEYGDAAGGDHEASIVRIPGHPPVHVYNFSFVENVSLLLSDKDLMSRANWEFKRIKVGHGIGERAYGDFNTSESWRDSENMLQSSGFYPKIGHFLAPVIIFDDSTKADNIGRLTAQPIMCTIGIISMED